MPAGLTLAESARRCALAAELEKRCFAVLGGWVQSTPEPVPKAVFARQARHHAWHAELFTGLAPAADGFAPRGHGVMPPAWAEVLDDLGDAASTHRRLVGWFRLVVPAKVAAYRAWLSATSPVNDGPARRWLRVVLADEREDHREGQVLLDGVAGPDLAPLGEEAARLAAVLWVP